MKSFSIFDPATGLLTGETFGGSESVVKLNIDRYCVEGIHDPLCRKVDIDKHIAEGSEKVCRSELVVRYVPDRPGEDFSWNEETERWEESSESIDRRNEIAKANLKIQALEQSQPRALRELILALSTVEDPQQGGAAAKAEMIDAARQRVAGIDSQIAEQRSIIQSKTLKK